METKDYAIVDPPWLYNDISPAVKKQLSYSLWDNNIKQMSFIFENIKVNYLFLWVTNSMLEDVFSSYFNSDSNFVYKTIITWKKTTKRGETFYGLGNSFRNCTEHIMLFSIDKAKPLRLATRNLFEARSGKRTQKPKNWESDLVFLLEKSNLKGSYIFSGPSLSLFNKFDIECVDIINKNKIQIKNIESFY